MKTTAHSRSANLLAAAVLSALTAVPAGAQINVAGTWRLEVSTDRGIATPFLTLEQVGDVLSGTYSSEALGQNVVRGSIIDSRITISFSADLQGESIPVIYRGTIDQNGEISGTVDIADGMLTGTFIATRSIS